MAWTENDVNLQSAKRSMKRMQILKALTSRFSHQNLSSICKKKLVAQKLLQRGGVQRQQLGEAAVNLARQKVLTGDLQRALDLQNIENAWVQKVA